MVRHNEYSPIDKSGEIISPRDIQDGSHAPSEDPDADLSITESENEHEKFNDRVSTDEEHRVSDAFAVAND